jgi:Fe-S-cluster containining protein
MSRYPDSIDKVVKYFAAVTREPFTYKGVTYKPHPLHVSPGIVRGVDCPAHCGACCSRFSLDYIPHELKPGRVELRVVEFNDKKIEIWSDVQQDHNDHFCRYVQETDGRCRIYDRRPFTCDFELIRVRMSSTDTPHFMTTQMYGRGWNMLQIDRKTRGALCDVRGVTRDSKNETIRKLKRLNAWAVHFEIKTKIEEIIEWLEQDDRVIPEQPLRIP